MNTVFRNYYAHPTLSYEGKPTGVLFGFLKTIADLQANISRNILVVWDHGIPVLGAKKPRNWREDTLSTYKATRSHDNPDWPLIVEQLPLLYRAIQLLGYGNVASMGLEADDAIGILAHEIPGEVLIFSTDQDFYQLLSDRVKILVPKKSGGAFQQVTQSGVETENGIPVHHWDRFLSLGGDSSDNIKPMRGMGPKTAIKLVQAGAQPALPWDKQTPNFREQYSKYREAWEAVQKCYISARIPRTRQDPRIAKYDFDYSSFNAPVSQTWPNDATRLRFQAEFEQFCADRDMVSLLAIRQQFFNTNTKRADPPCITIAYPSAILPKTLVKKRIPLI
jgi:DNA polymerase I